MLLGGFFAFLVLCTSFALLVFCGFRAAEPTDPTPSTHEELRIEWENSGEVDPSGTGFFTPAGERSRDLTESESQGLSEWRVEPTR